VLVISGGTLVDGTGRAPLSDSVIVIQGGQIVTVATVAAGGIPVDGRRLETHGKSIIPGLIDMRVHYYDFNQRSRQRCLEELLSCMFQSRRAFRLLTVTEKTG
jgi:N-acyl-D-aspartate/D-glutamate deacylase